MRIIVDFNSSGSSAKIRVFEKKHIMGILAATIVVLLITIYYSANKIATHWVQTNAPIIEKITEKEIQRRNERRDQLWQDSVTSLLAEIANLRARIENLQQNGIALADYMGLSGKLLFDTTEKDTLAYNALFESTTREKKAAQIIDWVYLQSAVSDSIENNYQTLSDYGIRRAIQTKTIPVKNPVRGKNWTTSRYGYRRDPFTGRKAFHSGNDYAARRGTPIIAGASGFVIYAGRLGNYGNAVQIYHGDGISTLYGHMHKIKAKKWSYVDLGEVIGEVGSTGRSSGPHLHYEVRLKNRSQSIHRTIKKLNKVRNISQDKKV